MAGLHSITVFFINKELRKRTPKKASGLIADGKQKLFFPPSPCRSSIRSKRPRYFRECTLCCFRDWDYPYAWCFVKIGCWLARPLPHGHWSRFSGGIAQAAAKAYQ